MSSPKTIAYLHISTNDENLEKNRADILNLANEKNLGTVHWVERDGLWESPVEEAQDCRYHRRTRCGDNLIVSELPRLDRSTMECMELLSIVAEKEINIERYPA